LACIIDSKGKQKLLVKENGIIAGVAFAKMIFEFVDPLCRMEDGSLVQKGDVVFMFLKFQSILKAGRS
jgi:nicotinate-nucleotide pyrophosphorylase (carboxylating)